MGTEVAMDSAFRPTGSWCGAGESLDEQVRRRGLRPLASSVDLLCEGVFESDQELDAFLTDLYESRRSNLA